MYRLLRKLGAVRGIYAAVLAVKKGKRVSLSDWLAFQAIIWGGNPAIERPSYGRGCMGCMGGENLGGRCMQVAVKITMAHGFAGLRRPIPIERPSCGRK